MTKIPKSQEQKKQRVVSNNPTESSTNPKEKPQIPDPDSPFSLTLVNRGLFTCSYCLKLLTSPVLQCIAQREHTQCSICAPEFDFDRCRHCFAKSFKSYDLMDEMLDSFHVPCQNVGFGCGETAMSLGTKRSHEEGCVFVPCSCPLCDFAGPIAQLASHFKGQHPKATTALGSSSFKSFDYDTKFTISLDDINEIPVFQEGKDGDLFLAFNEVIKDVGNKVSFRRMGPIRPPSPGREYFYEIEFLQRDLGYGYEKMKDNMSLKLVSPMVSVRSRLEKLPPGTNFLLVPEGLSYDDSLWDLKLTVRIWWQNVK